MYKITNIDKSGRIFLSMIYYKKTSDAVKNISEMELPVKDWETMEYEIKSGALNI